jgi:hypothetical protein
MKLTYLYFRSIFLINISYKLTHSVEKLLFLFTITVAQSDKKFLYLLWTAKYKETPQD